MNSNNAKLTIKKWGISERPREKYLYKGFQSLSDAELVAILIRSGSQDESAVDVGRRLLKMNDGSLNQLADMTIEELMTVPGIGEVKAITIKTVFELGQRRRSEKVTDKKKIKFATDIVELMQDKIAHIVHEEFWVIFLNQASKIQKVENFGKGGMTATTVDIRLIMKKALNYNATALLLCHNHPSGDVVPSEQDIRLTNQVRDAAMLFNIKLLDHLVLNKDNYFSFQAEGLL